MPTAKPRAKRVKVEVLDDDIESVLDGSLFHYSTDEDVRSLTSARTRSTGQRSPSKIKAELLEMDPDPAEIDAKPSDPIQQSPLPSTPKSTASTARPPKVSEVDTRLDDPMATLLDAENVYQIRLLPDLLITLVVQGIILRLVESQACPSYLSHVLLQALSGWLD